MWTEEAQRRWGSLVNETDIPDPWIIAINPKIHAFNIRLVVVYSPRISGSGENENDSFHRLLKKACQLQEKHRNLIVLGNFNAKISLAFKKCCCVGANVIPDDIAITVVPASKHLV